jgi:hypothetical protein
VSNLEFQRVIVIMWKGRQKLVRICDGSVGIHSLNNTAPDSLVTGSVCP